MESGHHQQLHHAGPLLRLIGEPVEIQCRPLGPNVSGMAARIDGKLTLILSSDLDNEQIIIVKNKLLKKLARFG